MGSFDSPIRVANELPPEIQIPQMIEICNKYGKRLCTKPELQKAGLRNRIFNDFLMTF